MIHSITVLILRKFEVKTYQYAHDSLLPAGENPHLLALIINPLLLTQPAYNNVYSVVVAVHLILYFYEMD